MKRPVLAVVALALGAVLWGVLRPAPANAQATVSGLASGSTVPTLTIGDLIITGSLKVGGGGMTTDGGVVVYGPVLGVSAGAVQIGLSGTNPGVWMTTGSPDTTNYLLSGAAGADTLINSSAGNGIRFRSGNSNQIGGANFATGSGTGAGLNTAINAGTAGSGTGFTTVATGSTLHRVHEITVARTALTAGATTQDITIWTVPAKTRIRALVVDGTAAFDDGAGPISALTITCGKTAGGAEYVVSGSLFTINTLGDATAEVGASLNTYFGDIPSWSATTAVQCRFTSTGGNLSTLTTGSATFYLTVETPP